VRIEVGPGIFLWVIVALYAAAGALYSVSVPLFEAPDEAYHYPVIWNIARSGSLPTLHPGIPTLWEQEASQPPLYYGIASLLTGWINTDDLSEVRQLNPFRKIGLINQPDNKNMVIHSPLERWPWKGTVLAVHLARLLNVTMGAAVITGAGFFAKELAPTNRWAAPLAAALLSFNPMFLLVTGAVNNDGLVSALSAWALVFGARALRRGFSGGTVVGLALCAGLAPAAKASGLIILGVALAAGALHSVQNRSWRAGLLTACGVLGVWIVSTGWWYLRNMQLYGEPLATSAHIAVIGARTNPIDWLLEARNVWVTYWGLFGQANVLGPAYLYPAAGLLGAGGLVGLVGWLRRRLVEHDPMAISVAGIAVLQFILAVAAVGLWTSQTYGSHGRLLYPAATAISGLMAVGLLAWLPERAHGLLTASISVLMLATALTTLFMHILPTYKPPAVIPAVPDGEQKIRATADQALEIVAIQADTGIPEDGQGPNVTVYLRAIRPLASGGTLLITAVAGDAVVGSLRTYPGGGLLPTDHMEPGVIYTDHYKVPLKPGALQPIALEIRVGWLDETNRTIRLERFVTDQQASVEALVLDLTGEAR